MWTRGSTIEMIDKDVNSPVPFRARKFSATGLRRFSAGTGCMAVCVGEIRKSLRFNNSGSRIVKYGDGVREFEMTR
jgi:hypothetical protein